MDFKSAHELLEICEKQGYSIADAMKERECSMAELSSAEILLKMKRVVEIMEQSSHAPLTQPVRSMGGLIGGEAARLNHRLENGSAITGTILSKALTYAMAVLEVNTSMGLIVAAPTAGASGVVPGLLLALKEEYHLSEETLIDGLFTASAVGYLAMRNATVSGAVGGCQAEVGVASAMAAAAAVQIMGGTPEQCLSAASNALMNLLGLVCDPIAGLVESPCQGRNAMGAANALTCAEIALCGILQLVPLDEMLDAMYQVGRDLPGELKETALGGAAATPTGCKLACGGCG